MDFNSYLLENSVRWQKHFLKVFTALSIVVLLTEIVIMEVFYVSDTMDDNLLHYIVIRIATPSSLNFFSLLIASMIISNPKIENKKKEYAVSILSVVVCGTVAIFHNYFKVCLFSFAVPFLMASIFADRKILHTIFAVSILGIAGAAWTMFTDASSLGIVDNVLSLLVLIVFVFFSYYLSQKLVNSHQDKIQYIISSYEKQKELVDELKIDPLTKLYNRIAMNVALGKAIENSNGSDIIPSVVIIDLDFFKNVNDTYGHSAGDEVLVQLADEIKNELGSSRKAFRFGGEEFLILFDNETKEKVFSKVESIRKSFNSHEFSFAKDKKFSLSAGICFYKAGMTQAEWFNKADALMYKAKAKGRNNTQISED